MFAGPRPKAVGSKKKASLRAVVQCCQQLTCFPDACLISFNVRWLCNHRFHSGSLATDCLVDTAQQGADFIVKVACSTAQKVSGCARL